MISLPSTYKKYFWDCDFNQLDLNLHKEFILKRLLNFGDLEAIKFVLTKFSHHYVSNMIKQKGEKVLSRTNLLFWQKLIKHNELWG